MSRVYLHMENGISFCGKSFGYFGETFGEAVFTTAMTGYPESLTDPSFAGQILNFGYPLQGNYAVPKPVKLAPHLMSNWESERIWASGVIVSSGSAELSDWLALQKVPGIADLDTREITHLIRTEGALRAQISPSSKRPDWSRYPAELPVPLVSCKTKIVYKPDKPNGKHIALIDCGVKHGILRTLLERGYKITRIPWDGDPLSIEGIDGVFVSNGPGDPQDCQTTIESIRRVLEAKIPYLGVCLGHQLLALAIGAKTYKLPFGHRGLNQPCLDVLTQKAYVTSQNHGYAVKRESIPADYQEWFVNLNDQTNEGIRHVTKNVASVQFHPEGHPGPYDTEYILGRL